MVEDGMQAGLEEVSRGKQKLKYDLIEGKVGAEWSTAW